MEPSRIVGRESLLAEERYPKICLDLSEVPLKSQEGIEVFGGFVGSAKKFCKAGEVSLVRRS